MESYMMLPCDDANILVVIQIDNVRVIAGLFSGHHRLQRNHH